jgi:6-phosphogluconolactonase
LLNIILNCEKPDVLISLSGGKTPFPVYQNLAKKLLIDNLSAKTFFIQTDERNIGSDQERSNQKAIRKSMFGAKGLPGKQFCAIDTLKTDYEKNLNFCLNGLPGPLLPPRQIDIAILGMGPDGHTASLFPETDWQNSESETGYRLIKPASQPEERISLTIKRLLQTRQCLFLVSGTNKSEALTRVLVNKDQSLPAGYLTARRPTTWILSPETVSSWPKAKILR